MVNVLRQRGSRHTAGITPVRAVCFDLDDTLYPQASWLAGAWRAVADLGARASHASGSEIDPDRLLAELEAIAAFGTDSGQIIDRALYRLGASHLPVEPLVAAFRAHAPARLEPYPGVPAALDVLHARVPLGLVSDGDPAIQAAKLGALGLAPTFSVIVWSDDHGRAHRKPDPLPFQLAAQGLDVDPATVVYVGDRPAKDVAGAAGAGMRSMRVRTGEWVDAPDDDRALGSFDSVLDAIEELHRLLDDQGHD
jgi:FMN phosphatase YigB (HAD superfamily)